MQAGSAHAGQLRFDAERAPSRGVPATPPFAAPGERMTYRLALHGVEVAAFSIAVGEVTEVVGRSALAVEAGVQSTGIAAVFKKVRTDFASWIDVQSGRPILGRVVETAGVNDPAIETSEARFHQLANRRLPIAIIATDASETIDQQTVMTETVWDVPSILLYLRGWKGEIGDELTTEIVRSRYIWRSRFRIAAHEAVVTDLGQLAATRIDGVSRRVLRDGKWEPQGDIRNMSLWITDDADRVPVLVVARTDFGDVRMAIVDYRGGRSANLRGAR